MAKRFYILALIGLLLQCMPAKSCVVQQALVGASCHQLPTPTATAFPQIDHDACAGGHETSHSDACTCEQPEPSSDRVVKVPLVGFDILGEVTFALRAATELHPAGQAPAVTTPPPLPCRLPLLN